MKIYQGFRKGYGVLVYVDNQELDITRSLTIRHHADSFEWGYRGSGPTQLALALMLDLFDEKTALDWYLFFRNDIINELQHDNWVLLDTQIKDWLDNKLKKPDKDENLDNGWGTWWL
jgi:hypothetical protein